MVVAGAGGGCAARGPRRAARCQWRALAGGSWTAQAQATQQFGTDMSGVDQGLQKQAQDYDHIGRVLAHHAFTDMVKEALDEEMAGDPEEEKKKALAAILAKARGEGGEKEEGEGKEEDKEEKEGDDEKKASVKRAILQKMASDPEYAAYLAAKYLEG